MKISKPQIVVLLLAIFIVILIGIWTGSYNNIPVSPGANHGNQNNSVMAVTPNASASCQGYIYIIPAGGDVFIGEKCLDISASVSSGDVVTWYNRDQIAGKNSPDAVQPIGNARNFFVDPDIFLGHEGPWYVGTTKRVAFVVKVPILDSQSGKVAPTNYGPYTDDANTQIKPPGSFEGSDKIESSLWNALNSTNRIDLVRAWVIVKEPADMNIPPVSNLSSSEKSAWRVQQRGYYLNATKPVFDAVRSKIFGVNYIGQTSPAILVEVSPSCIQELARRPDIRKMYLSKVTPPLAYEMGQRRADETIRVGISIAEPPGLPPIPEGYISEKPVAEYYADNKAAYENQSRPILDLLRQENVRVQQSGPYPFTAIFGDVPVHVIEELGTKSEVSRIDVEIQYRPL